MEAGSDGDGGIMTYVIVVVVIKLLLWGCYCFFKCNTDTTEVQVVYVETTPDQTGHENHAGVAQPEISVIDMPPQTPPPPYAEAVLSSPIPSSEVKNNAA